MSALMELPAGGAPSGVQVPATWCAVLGNQYHMPCVVSPPPQLYVFVWVPQKCCPCLPTRSRTAEVGGVAERMAGGVEDMLSGDESS